MTLLDLSSDHEWVKYPAFYNVYPLLNEVHVSAIPAPVTGTPPGATGYFVDTLYGRTFEQSMKTSRGLYGLAPRMDHYAQLGAPVVAELRVPYRKIPVIEVSRPDQIVRAVEQIESENIGYQILMRGQTRPHYIARTTADTRLFYGEDQVQEPSFLPSNLRNNFDEVFLNAMWINQAAMLFNDIGVDYASTLSEPDLASYRADTERIQNSALMTAFALGIAQHYGMPSVGLDLTDKLDVANWFASNTMNIDATGATSANKVDSAGHKSSFIYVFRCPKNAVFDYQQVKPRIFPAGRPDAQHAWFGHVGWGAAQNQLASYLVCAFHLSEEYLAGLPEHMESVMFPKLANDEILNYFVKMRNQQKYEGDAQRALGKIYFFE